ncbi:extracellular solute-binding protein [Paenibacillus sp. HB172176]|uniref:extracellular solute-binding protein n=1 Tax=Paenibacillus sp. HB172176 TaxID=2493690 RepID=UPI0014387479|nr:extracellular solute-binding protein [Paenibacillus sp. HB172176]
MKIRKKQRMLGGLLTLVLLSALIAGCSGNKEENQGEARGGKAGDGAPTEISIMLPSAAVTPPKEGNEVQREIEKQTNTKLHIQWVSGAYEDKANVTLASGELPDLMTIKSPDIFGNVFRTMTQQGAFWDIAPYIKDYPNISKLPQAIWDKVTMDGKIYGVPRPRALEGATFYVIRQDWLDNLGLAMPTNQEELFKVWEAFTFDDPDQNGKDDTIGFAGSLGHVEVMSNLFTKASGIYGSVTAQWKLQDDGKLINTALLPSLRDSLVMMRKAIEEKLVPEDAVTIKSEQINNLFISGKAGTKLDKSFSNYKNELELRKVDPNAVIVPIPVLNGYAPQDLGFLNMIAISKKVPEAKMKKLLAFLDYGLSDEAYDLAQWGIKDIHYTEENGERTKTDRYTSDSISDYLNLIYQYDRYGNTTRPNMPDDMKAMLEKTVEEKEKVSVPDYSFGLVSETNLTAGVELSKKIDDMKTKVLLGKESMEAWDTFVEDLKVNPDLIKITDELNAALQELKGK